MPFRPLHTPLAVTLGLVLGCSAALPGLAQTPPLTPDIPPVYLAPTDVYDYVKREAMIPMRDGVKLYTVILVPKGARNAAMLLTRTPYKAKKRAQRAVSASLLATLPEGDEVFVAGGYIRVYQDVRGKYDSEGEYVLTRPARGPLNASGIDHATDAWDTIDWLIKSVPETNGRVGMLGSSYDGFTVVMALLDPHPALRVAAPQCPMIDGWRGDDWFHNGAFRQVNLDYFNGQTAVKGEGDPVARAGYDDYETFRRAGSAGAFARAAGLEQLPWWRKTLEHPAYDDFWQRQALDKLLADQPLKVPTMWVHALWDQEDSYGAIHAYAATEPKDRGNDLNFLVLGPWRHSQQNGDGSTLGPLRWPGDTALQWRRDYLKPFFDQHLKDGAPPANTPPVIAFNTGESRWEHHQAWPLACRSGCAATSRPLYLAPGFELSFDAPPAVPGAAAYDEYVSDPAKPVPYIPRPVSFANRDAWRTWLVTDQRAVADRPDVLTYQSAPLTAPVRISGSPLAHLVAATSGTDADWVVKLIDVHPDEVPSRPELGGYQLAVAMEIFRGRYRESLEHPKAIAPDRPLAYRIVLPTTNHVFQRGHRIMVQVQSSWFPLYDRNPQTFVPSVFFAGPADYVKATHRVYRAGDTASFLELPVVDETPKQGAGR
jgi:uncharacterized protein